MQIILSGEDFTQLSDEARQEIQALLFPRKIRIPKGYEDCDWTNVIDMTPRQTEELMQGLGGAARKAMKVIAGEGPVVDALALSGTGIANPGSFQSGIHRRLRNVTGNQNACLFTFDDWAEQPEGIGHFIISRQSHESLLDYFSRNDITL